MRAPQSRDRLNALRAELSLVFMRDPFDADEFARVRQEIARELASQSLAGDDTRKHEQEDRREAIERGEDKES